MSTLKYFGLKPCNFLCWAPVFLETIHKKYFSYGKVLLMHYTFSNHTHRIDHEKMFEVIKPYKAETEGRLVKITQHLIYPTQNL